MAPGSGLVLNGVFDKWYEYPTTLKCHAWTDSGWDRMLNDNFRQPIESALQAESRRHTVDALSSDEDAVRSVQDGIAAKLKERVSRLLGDDTGTDVDVNTGRSGRGTCSRPVNSVTMSRSIRAAHAVRCALGESQ